MAEKQASVTAVAIAVGLIGVTLGYFLGQGSSIGLFGDSGNPAGPHRSKGSWPNNYDVALHPDSSDEEAAEITKNWGGKIADSDADDSEGEEGDGKELKSFVDTNDEVKLVLVVRTDLGMTKGWSRAPSHISSKEPD